MGVLGFALTLMALNGLLLAVLLAASPGNRSANRFLSALVALISLRLAIYILGFAGAYDDYPWLTFVPLDASLAFGPLLWLYIRTLTRGAPPRGWQRHLIPAATQLCYMSVAFALPLPVKLAWYRDWHLYEVEPAGLIVLLVSCATYLTLAWREQRDHQAWLDGRFADRDRWRLGWMRAVLVAFAATLCVAAAAVAINAAIVRLDYFGRVPVIVSTSLLAYALGLIGWRQAGLDLPVRPLETDTAGDPTTPSASRAAASFPEWRRRIEAERWWLEEGLTLPIVAARLAVSERTLSRGISEGAGLHFNALVNGMRVDAVMRAIESGVDSDLLTIALDCGFSSKASFNRAFLRHTGVTPSRWRASTSQEPPMKAIGAT